VEIDNAARKHGVLDEDMRHAARHVVAVMLRHDNVTLIAGPARNGELLEIGIVDLDSDAPAIVHAMPLRRGYRRYLDQR
jgi:hypothetical protein